VWYNIIYNTIIGRCRAAVGRERTLSNVQVPVKGDDFYKKVKGGTWIENAVMLYGEEEYMKQNARRLLERTVCPDESFRDMNLIRFDTLSYSAEALSDSFASAPVFAEQKLVVLSGLDIDGMREGEFNALLSAIDAVNEYPGNFFALVVPSDKLTYVGRADRLKRFNKLCELLRPIIFEKYTLQRLVPWCRMHFEADGCEVEPDFLKQFISYVSDDMSILDGEIRKLCCYVRASGRTEPTLADVEAVCTSYEEFGAFDLTNAILSGNRTLALRIIRRKKEDRIEPVIVLAEISNVVYDIIAIKSMLASGMSRDEMAALTKLKDYPLRLRTEAANKFNSELLEALLNEIIKADRNLKSGIPGYGGIERIVCLF
jgi:DNA polymerase-3 subunit delta